MDLAGSLVRGEAVAGECDQFVGLGGTALAKCDVCDDRLATVVVGRTHDRRLEDRWDQYLFGPDLMVAPVWRIGERSRPVYFPKGTWRSYWNASEVYQGPRTVTVDAPLDTIPVFRREGAVVPGP